MFGSNIFWSSDWPKLQHISPLYFPFANPGKGHPRAHDDWRFPLVHWFLDLKFDRDTGEAVGKSTEAGWLHNWLRDYWDDQNWGPKPSRSSDGFWGFWMNDAEVKTPSNRSIGHFKRFKCASPKFELGIAQLTSAKHFTSFYNISQLRLWST